MAWFIQKKKAILQRKPSILELSAELEELRKQFKYGHITENDLRIHLLEQMEDAIARENLLDFMEIVNAPKSTKWINHASDEQIAVFQRLHQLPRAFAAKNKEVLSKLLAHRLNEAVKHDFENEAEKILSLSKDIAITELPLKKPVKKKLAKSSNEQLLAACVTHSEQLDRESYQIALEAYQPFKTKEQEREIADLSEKLGVESNEFSLLYSLGAITKEELSDLYASTDPLSAMSSPAINEKAKATSISEVNKAKEESKIAQPKPKQEKPEHTKTKNTLWSTIKKIFNPFLWDLPFGKKAKKANEKSEDQKQETPQQRTGDTEPLHTKDVPSPSLPENEVSATKPEPKTTQEVEKKEKNPSFTETEKQKRAQEAGTEKERFSFASTIKSILSQRSHQKKSYPDVQKIKWADSAGCFSAPNQLVNAHCERVTLKSLNVSEVTHFVK